MVAAREPHEARASAMGYLFQCRYALLMAIQAIPDAPQFEIAIEKFDDVSFEADGEPTHLIQTKHHVGRRANLTDASVDLWKTLLVWSKRVAKDVEAPFRTKFVLLTTGSAPDGSAASFLRMRDRHEKTADQLLMRIASTSRNQQNAEAYAAYKALSEDLRLALLRSVFVLDGSPNIIDVREEIARELHYAAGRENVDRLVERLEGWWFGVIIKALASINSTAIPVLAIDQRIDELREEFRRTALPVDYASAVPTQDIVAELDKRPFVKQLRKIEIGRRRIEFAIRDYYRASEQRSRWAREELLVDGELEKYERELIELWEPRHAAMLDELAPTCQPEQKVAAGKELFKWVENDAHVPLRTVRDRFLTHGSYQILSNRYAVGWHPDYREDAYKQSADGEE
jgi:C-terminal domain 7 of the ABC-three component (ABC-3C) systems